MTRKVYAILVVTFLALLGLGLHSHQHSKQLCRNNRKSITVRDLRTITEPLSSLETASLCPEVKGSARTTTKEAKTTEVTPAAVDQTVSDATRFEGETRDVRVVVTAAEGVFPAGTEMRVTPASAETTMAAAQKQCDDEQEVVDAVAADITFWFDGREIQPDGNVIVSMYAKRNVEGETHEAVTVRHDGIAEVMGDACGNMGAFTTDHFTVYAIVGKTYGGRNMTKYARQVYNFYLDGTLIQTQIVKNGDALVAPPAPGGYSKKEFIGWFKENTDTEFPFGTVSIPSTQTTNDTFRIDARFKDLYKATFYANLDKSIIFQVKSAESGQTVTINDVVMPDSTHLASTYKIFDGWKGLDGNVVADDTTIAGTDIELVPNFVKGNWVFFDSRGGSYVRDTLVKEGGKVTEPEAPTYEGHTFLGWEIYNATDSKYEDFDFENTPITNTTTLFAKWQKNQTRYKIKIWHENADDENYTLVDSMYKDGNVGENIPFDELLQTFTRDKYDGFHLNQTALPTWFNNISNFTKQFNYQAQYSIYGDYDHGWYGEPYYGGDAGYGDWLRDSANTNRYLFSVNANGDTTYFFRWYIDESTWDTVWTNDTIKVFSYYDAGAYIDLGHPFLIFQNGLPSGYAVVDTTMTLVDPAINKWQVTLNGINSTDGDITIHEDGSTVVNIYYSRDTYRFLFRFGRVYCENDSGRVWNENEWSWCNDYYSNPDFDWSFDCGNLWYDYYYKNCSRNEDNSGMAVNKLNRSNFQRSLNHFHINPHHNWNSNYMLSTSYYNEAQNKTVYPMYWVVTVSGIPYDRQYRYTDLWNTAMSVKYGENLYRAINNLNSNYHSSSDQPIETRAKVGYFIDDVDWAWYATWKEDNLGCDFTPYMNQEEINPTKDNQITFDGNFLKNADGTPKYPHGSEVQMVLRRFDKDGFMQYRHPYTYYYEGFPNDVTGVRSNSYYNKSQSDTTGISKTIDGTNHTFVSYDDKIVWGTVYYPENAWLNRPMEGFTTVLVENYKSNSTAIYPETTTSVTGDPQLWKFFSRDDEWQSIPYRLFQYTFVSGTNNKVIQDTTYLNNVTDDQVHPTISFYNIRNQYPVKFMDSETVLVDSSFYYEQYLNLSPELADSLHVIALNRIDDVVLKGNKVTKHENGISYRFEGWYTDPQYVYPASFPTIMPYHELTYHAKWVPDSVAVTFHFENGQSDTTIMVKYDNACALPDAPVWEGHSFIRWEDANDIAFNENGTMLKDTNVYARWSTFFTYAVRYNAGTAGTFSTETDPCTYLEGAYAATLGMAVPNNTADTIFSGWRIGNSDNILTQGLFAINSTNDEADTKDSVITLNAVYTPVPRFVTQITYHANYPTRSAADTTIAQNYIINDDYVINQDTTSLGFRMAGYKFFAWSPEASPNVLNYAPAPDRVLYFTGDTIALEAQDNHLYAIWTPMMELTVSKVWNDNGNQDGMRPASVKVKLLADGDSVNYAVLNAGNNWQAKFEGLDKYKAGTKIAYSIVELNVPENYNTPTYGTILSTSGVDTLTVTNTHTPDSMYVNIVKFWNDNGNNDGKRPDSIKVTLTADGTLVGDTMIIKDDDPLSNYWHYMEQIKLPVFKDGDSIKYAIAEVPVDGYNTSITCDTLTAPSAPSLLHYTITNTHIPDSMYVKVAKVWDDNNNSDGKRPASVSVRLMKRNPIRYVSETVTLNGSNNWTHQWGKLPVFENGDSIKYFVSEESVNQYDNNITHTGPVNGVDSFTVTNTRVPDSMLISVKKLWEDHGNQDGKRPTSVSVTLYANDVAVENGTVTLNAGNNWEHLWGRFPFYEDGDTIKYTVTEEPVAEYTDSIVIAYIITADIDIRGPKVDVEAPDVQLERLYPANKHFIVTNTHIPDSMYVKVTKVWNDVNNQDGKRPASVDLFLKAGTDTVGTATLSASNNWKHQWGKLPVFKEGEEGDSIKYTVVEATVDKYTTAILRTGRDGVDSFTVTNTHTPETMTVTANKIWADHNNVAGKRPAKLVYTLEQDGHAYNDTHDTVTVTNGWSKTWTNLPKYHDGGVPYNYSVSEDQVDNYSSSDPEKIKNDANNTITFNFTNSYTPGKTSITVTKAWNDGDNQDGLRPTNVTVQLQRKPENSTVWTDTLSPVSLSAATNNWNHTFSNLEMYVPGLEGVRYEYRVRELDPSNNKIDNGGQYFVGTNGRFYTIEYLSEGNLIVRNSMTPETTKVVVKKIWNDDNNRDAVRPESVTVQLKADGNDCREPNTLKAANNWTCIYENLPKYNHSTTPIVYTVTEETVPAGYSVAYGELIHSTEADTLPITNTHELAKVEVTVNKVWDDNNNQDGARPNVSVQLYADGDEVGAPVALTESNLYTHTWSGLDKYQEDQVGQPVLYTLQEVGESNGKIAGTVAGTEYTVTYAPKHVGEVDNLKSVAHNDTMVITNSYTPDSINIAVYKNWDDNNNADNLREPVKVVLYQTTDATLAFNPATENPGWNVASDTLTIPVCTETTNWMECHVSWSVPVYSAGNELRYAVKEVSTIADYVTTYAHGGLLTLENDNSEIITNLHRSSVSVDFDVHKKLRGRVWLETDTFAVALLPTQNSNPMPDGTPVFSGTPYSIMKMFSTQEHVNDSVRRNGFGEITFTMDDLEGKSDSTFVYRIFELTPGASALPEIPGITYDGTLYQAEVTVSVVPGEDSLQASVAYFVLHNDDSKIPAELPLITNIFNESYIIYKINAYKILTSYDAPGLGDNEFSFTLKPVGENAATAPMPAGTNADRILTAHNEGTEVKFHDSDNPNDGLRFDYDELRLSGFTDEQLLDGIHFGYEMSEVIPADAVFNNDGTATYSKNANGITTYYDAVIHHRSLFVKMEEVNDVVVLSVHPDLSVHKDFYLNGNDTVWLAATDPGFDKRHSFGGAPIFVNFRIADTAVAVKKEWVDGGNTGNFRPENLTVTLYANGESTNQTATLNANNLWTCRFEGLPTAILNETLGFDTLRYTVVETPVEHYLTPEYSGNAAIGYTITNTLEEKFVNIPVTKIWNDQSNNDGFRPDSVTFQLTGHTDLTDTVFTMKVGGEGNQWDTVFKNLPKYDGARNEFVYTLSEPNTPNHYEQSVNGYTVTNIHVPETTSITVNKIWDDNNDQDGKRQEVTVTVQLNANGEYYDMQTLDEGNSYKYTFENLPVFANGQRIIYTVSEWDMDYYTPYITSNDTGFTITNKHEPEYIEITAKKNWIDQNNHDNLRPSSVNVRLMAYTVDPFTGNFDNGTPIAFNPIYANQNWKISFGTWPKYANGNEILYLIEEDPVDHYTTLQPIGQFISDDKIEFTISNQHIPDSIDLTVCKIWDDNHDVDQLRENVYMLLFRSYNPTATFDPEHLPANGNSDWVVVGNPFYLDSEIDTVSVTWAHMPKYYQGTEVRYAVKELNCPSNYTASYHFGGELLESNEYVDTIINRHLTAAVTVNIPAVRKKLVGRNWLETDTFYMALIPRRSTQPMPTTVASIDGINYAPLAITANSTFVNDSMREGVFAPITFTMDDMEGETTKTFTYRIREITPAEMGFTRIPGISYGADFYMVDIIVSENNNNELVIDSWHYYRAAMNEEQNELIRLDEVANPVITNRYSDSTTVYHMTADKQLTIVGYADTLRTGDYHFMLKPVGENADRAPMPYYTTGTGVNRSLTVPNEGNVVRFYNDTLPVDGLVFNYDSLIAAGFTAEQLTQGVEFEYEMHEIIPDGATYTNNGFWTKPAVREGQMIDEIYDGLVHYRNLRIKMVEVNNKVILSITSVNDDHMRDYFVDANGDTTFVTHESPMFNQRHGEGGAPIFRNGRIARLSIPVEKSWDDFDNELSTRPAEVTVTLLADGEPTDYTITLNASNEWQAAFENLPASTPTTGLITYTVREDSVPHYEATYRGDMENGFFIINTLTSFGEDDECTIMVGIEQLNACTEAECPSIVTDMDGITYPTVKVDGYCWMAENLRTQTPNAMVYRSALSPDTVANLATYGRLYTWFDAAGGTETPEAVNGYVRGICPNGWHLPTVQEINVLRTHRSDDLYGEASWVTTGLNSTGFNALPAGFYNAAADRFEGLHSVTYLHGATEATAFSVVYYCCRIMEWHYAPGNAYSVRCVKDCE